VNCGVAKSGWVRNRCSRRARTAIRRSSSDSSSMPRIVDRVPGRLWPRGRVMFADRPWPMRMSAIGKPRDIVREMHGTEAALGGGTDATPFPLSEKSFPVSPAYPAGAGSWAWHIACADDAFSKGGSG
jgi:hypothetical protein